MDPLNSLWRMVGLAALLLGSAAWCEAGGGSGGPGSNAGGGGGGNSGSGMSRPINLSMPSIGIGSGNNSGNNSGHSSGNGPGNRQPNSPNNGSNAGKEAPRGDDPGKDGPGGRDGPTRRETDERGTAALPRPGSDGPDSRWQRGERLVRTQPLVYERDPIGAPVLRAEIMMLLPLETELPASLARRGFIAVRETQVLGRRLVVLRTPADLTLPMAVDLGRRLVPDAEIDFNHVLLGSGRAEASRAPPAPAAPPASSMAPVHVGLIDEAVMPGGPLVSLAELRPTGRRCTPTTPPEGHGQAVAMVLARGLQQAGAKPVLHAADLGCGQGAVDAMAAALQAMDTDRVPVVNISAVGPYNRVMAAVVAAFLARGHLLVAAVGNDGPAAPPLYPAAYPGVIGVTAVDAHGRVLVEAGRGAHVAFAAPGIVDLPAADGSLRTWRGTSLAAPVVSAALALRLTSTDTAAAQAAVAQLARNATDAGEPGRDRVYGHGVIGLTPPALAAAH